MGGLSDLNSAVEQLRNLDQIKVRLLGRKWAYEREHEKEIEKLEIAAADCRQRIGKAKSEIMTAVLKMRLNRREEAPLDTHNFCDAVSGWIERAKVIRKASTVAYIDGRDLDIPDIDILEDEPNPLPCFPCKVHKVVRETLSEMRPEYREVLRVRYCLRSDERFSASPGSLPYQWYIAKQLGVSQATVSQLLKKATRSLVHPSRSPRIAGLVSDFDANDVQCPAEYMVVEIFGATR